MTTIETLSLPNFQDSNILGELELSADALAAQKIINVLNSAGVMDTDFLCLSPTAEISEIRAVDTAGVSANQITFSQNLALLHRNHERVVKLFGDTVRVYRAPNVDGTIPDDSTFSLIGSTVISPDQTYSTYTDNSGGSDFWYKFTYYNSTSHNETDKALSEATRGGGWGHYDSLESIRNEAGLDLTKKLSDTEIAKRRDAAESEVDGATVAAGYIMPLQTQAGKPYVPALITEITRLLAAGKVLMQNFGTTKPSSSKDGQSKIDEARASLAKIQLNDIVLVDSNKQMLAKPALVSGVPNDTTADDGVNIGPIMTLDKVF